MESSAQDMMKEEDEEEEVLDAPAADDDAEGAALDDEEITKQGMIAKLENENWVSNVATTGIESHQILYKLTAQSKSSIATKMQTINDPYFQVVQGASLRPYMGPSSLRSLSPNEQASFDSDFFFFNLLDLSSFARFLKNSHGVSTRDQTTDELVNPSQMKLTRLDGSFITIAAAIPYRGAPKFISAVQTHRGGIPGDGGGMWETVDFSLADHKTNFDAYIQSISIQFNKTDIAQLTKGGFTWIKKGVRSSQDLQYAPEDGLYVRLRLLDFNKAAFSGAGITAQRGFIEKKHFQSIWASTGFKELFAEPSKTPKQKEITGKPGKQGPPTKKQRGDPDAVGDAGQKKSADTPAEDMKTEDATEPQSKPELKAEETIEMEADPTTDNTAEVKDGGKTEAPVRPGLSEAPGRIKWEALVGQKNDKPGSDCIKHLFFRDESGTLHKVDMNPRLNMSVWMGFYERGTTQPDFTGGRFPRGVDLDITLHIHQQISDEERYGKHRSGPDVGKPRQTLKGLFDKVKANAGKSRTKIVFYPNETHKAPDKATHTLISCSCFGDYHTYISNIELAEYLDSAVTKLRKVPSDMNRDILTPFSQKQTLKGPMEKLLRANQATATTYHDWTKTDSNISADKILKARGTRSSQPGQASIMKDINASDIASVLGWDPMRATTAKSKWDKERFATAEWLHRVGYAYGGLDDTGYGSSQQVKNLVFGTSETNSIMTRYEDCYRNAILRERTLVMEMRSAALEAGKQGFNEEITSAKLVTEFGNNVFEYTAKGSAISKTPIGPPGNAAKALTWPELGKRYPWMCGQLNYDFQLTRFKQDPNAAPMVSRIHGNKIRWVNDFYPFQRMFFSRIEGIVDDQICHRLWEIALLQFKADLEKTAAPPTMSRVESRTVVKGVRKKNQMKVDDPNTVPVNDGKLEEKVGESQEDQVDEMEEETVDLKQSTDNSQPSQGSSTSQKQKLKLSGIDAMDDDGVLEIKQPKPGKKRPNQSGTSQGMELQDQVDGEEDDDQNTENMHL